jgi:hypothetical protein
MTTTPFATRALAIIACALTLAACGTTKVAPPKPSLQEMLSQASQAAASGNKEQAIKVWQQTASTYPEDKTPWANIAQARYEAGQYGDAIMSAEEVLVRDPKDQLANSIIAISGLRLSTRAIGELRSQNNITGSLRTESQDLAKLLRESLGETVLVPPTPPKPTVTAGGVKKGGSTIKKAAKPANESADPFADLK